MSALRNAWSLIILFVAHFLIPADGWDHMRSLRSRIERPTMFHASNEGSLRSEKLPAVWPLAASLIPTNCSQEERACIFRVGGELIVWLSVYYRHNDTREIPLPMKYGTGIAFSSKTKLSNTFK